jgi:drug/metabolite transporter (DMT)-like permease
MLKWRPPVRALSFLFCTLAAGAAFSLPFYLWEVSAGGTMLVSGKTVAAIGYLAIFPSIVAYICWNHAVMALGPNVAGFFNPVIPVFGTLFAVTFLGEPLRLYHLAGFALVIGGVVLTFRR